MAGIFQEKATEMLVNAMGEFGIEPGELNERIGRVLDLIEEFAPVVQEIGDTADDLENHIQELEGDLNNLEEVTGDFNDNSEQMVDAMDNLADSLDKFSNWMEQLDEEHEE